MTVDIAEYKVRKLFERCQPAINEWNNGDHVRTDYSGLFYQGIYGMEEHFTGYSSIDAVLAPRNQRTYDHFLSPRLTFRAMMDMCTENLTDYVKFKAIVNACQHTICITRNQNNGSIKFRMEGSCPVIKLPTITKYDSFGWFLESKGVLKEYRNGSEINKPFPLKHMIPEWLTTWELQYVTV